MSKGRKLNPEERAALARRFAAGRGRRLAERREAGPDYWANRTAKAGKTRAKWQAALARRKRKLGWAVQKGRLDLVARHEEAIKRLTPYLQKALRKELRAKTKAELDAAFVQQDRRLDALDVPGAQRKWTRDRKITDKHDRIAKREGSDRSGHDETREEMRRPGQNPNTGATDLLTVNARHDVLEYLLAHRKITTQEKLAGDHLRSLCERAGLSGAKGIDYESAGAGQMGSKTPVSETMMQACDELEWIEEKLGVRMFNLLVRVVHHGLSIAQIAKLGEDIERAQA
jgi:hypothetical protein